MLFSTGTLKITQKNVINQLFLSAVWLSIGKMKKNPHLLKHSHAWPSLMSQRVLIPPPGQRPPAPRTHTVQVSTPPSSPPPSPSPNRRAAQQSGSSPAGGCKHGAKPAVVLAALERLCVLSITQCSSTAVWQGNRQLLSR